MKTKIFSRSLLAALVVGATGCSSLGPKAPIERVSDDTYVNQWDDNQRTEYDTQMPILSDRWLKKQQTDYRAGFPVHFGEGKTAGTILRNRLLDRLQCIKDTSPAKWGWRSEHSSSTRPKGLMER